MSGPRSAPATGRVGAGRSCPVELAMEHGDRPEVLLAQPFRERLRQGDRAVIAAGAAERDREPGLALADVGREHERQELAEIGEELLGHRLTEDEGPNLRRQTGQLAE